MATTSKHEFEEIKVTGPVSVAPVDGAKKSGNWRTVLVMGPTGSGKSSFIEALGLKGSSKISSHDLDGYTHTLSTYILNNVTRRGDPIYLVDSPGFADTKISEMAITSMLQKWIQDNGYFNYILYLTPITKVRLPGSQRQILKTFNALTGVESAKNVMVVATMWDTIYGEHVAKRAEETYKQYQDDIWKDFMKRGGRFSRFQNTKESVLSILDQVFGLGSGQYFSVEEHKGIIKGSPFETNLLADLQVRIRNLNMDLGTIRLQLDHAEDRSDERSKSVVLRNLQEAEQDLARFQLELDNFYAIPLPHTTSDDEVDGDDGGERSLDHEESSNFKPSSGTRGLELDDNVAEKIVVTEDSNKSQEFAGGRLEVVGRVGVENSGVIASGLSHPPAHIVAASPVVPLVPHAAVALEAITSSTPPSDAQQYITPTLDLSFSPVSQPQQLEPVLMRFVKSMKCWGKDVGERHEA